MNRILWSLKLVVALLFPSPLPASAAKQPFSVTLAAPDKPIKAGADVRLLATIKNISDHDIAFVVSPGPIPEDWFRYTIKVLDEHARPAPPSAQVLELRKLRESKKPVWGMWSSNLSRTLKPCESFIDQINVTRDYDLSRPGIYTLWVTRSMPPKVTSRGVEWPPGQRPVQHHHRHGHRIAAGGPIYRFLDSGLAQTLALECLRSRGARGSYWSSFATVCFDH